MEGMHRRNAIAAVHEFCAMVRRTMQSTMCSRYEVRAYGCSAAGHERDCHLSRTCAAHLCSGTGVRRGAYAQPLTVVRR